MVLQDADFDGVGFDEGQGTQTVVVLTDTGSAVATGMRAAPRAMNATVITVLRVISSAAQGQPGVPVDEQEIIMTPGTGGPMLVAEALDRLEGYGYVQRGPLGQ